MKRFVFLTALIALLFALALPAAADVAYIPQDDFLQSHMAECRYENRMYYTNGIEGYVLAHKSPESSEGTPLPNGRAYLISSIYQDRWGVLEFNPDTKENAQFGDSVVGWVELDQMVADYDNFAFCADHAAELVDQEGRVEIGSDQTLFAYKYPGSGEVIAQFGGDWVDSIDYYQTFKDPAGRTWGHCGYFYGLKNFWICADDPFNDALPPDENCVTIETAVKTPGEPSLSGEPDQPGAPAQTEEPDQPAGPVGVNRTIKLKPTADAPTISKVEWKARGNRPYIAAAAAGVVVIAAAVLFVTLRKKKKSKK